MIQDRSIIEKEIELFQTQISFLKLEMGKSIIGQKHLVDSLLIALYSNGHILLEGLPGLAKTLAIKSLASCLGAKYSRIQFTPDLLPADLIGTMIYNQKLDDFMVRRGPIFANLVLADEINRAPAKVQSALLEAMQERQVTLGEATYALESPFLVMATQNPLEQEGTYSLPEAQLDRFLLKVRVDYPSPEEELEIIRQPYQASTEPITPVISLETIARGRDLVKSIFLEERLEKYIIQITMATRNPGEQGLKNLENLISFGASPRGSLSLAMASRAHAFLSGRSFVLPEDIHTVFLDVLRHRIGLTYEAEAENYTTDRILSEIIKTIPVP
jgi:MoxR-like ATPase